MKKLFILLSLSIFLLTFISCEDTEKCTDGSYQCKAKTKKGPRCKRSTDWCEAYCWQHD